MSNLCMHVLSAMMHSPIQNYGGIPGITSWLIGTPGENGLVRLLMSSRDHQEPIIPHSHRFDFHCMVLSGRVRNILWVKGTRGDRFQESTLTYGGAPGQYECVAGEQGQWAMHESVYVEEQEYSMRAEEVHSIYFARGTSVLFFEGPRVSSTSIILEPVVDGIVVPTFDVKPWAFKREPAGSEA
jgi:hypothetical protein